MEDYFCNRKESEKEKTKNYYQINKEKLKKTRKITRELQKSFRRRKIKKRDYANIRNRNTSDTDRDC